MGIFQGVDGHGYIECDVCHFVEGPVVPGRPVNQYTKRKWRTRSLGSVGKRWLCSNDCEERYMADPK